MRALATALVLALGLGVAAHADDILVLKDGRKIPVTRLSRRDGLVVLETTKGEVFSVPEDQVVSPPLASIPAATEGPQTQTLVLKDGRKIPVKRLGRRTGIVVLETSKGETFSVPEDQVVSPPLASIPADTGGSQTQTLVLKDGRKIPVRRLARRSGAVVLETLQGEVFAVPEDQVVSPPLASIAAAQPGEGPQVLVLKDGRKIPVVRLARKSGSVVLQTTKGDTFSVPEDQVLSPALDSIPAFGAPTEPAVAPTPAPEPEAPTAPTAPTTPTPSPRPTPAPPPEFIPLKHRWDIPFPDDPRNPRGRLIDPYNQNILKGDKPFVGDSLFLVLTGTLEAPLERRRLPVPSGVSALNPGSLEFFGQGDQTFTSPRALVSAEIFKGQTAFLPKAFSFKVTGAFDLNYLTVKENNEVNIDVRKGTSRRTQHASLEEAFGEVKLADLSPNFDFLSVRAGIQPFSSDFRGFIFSDSNLGARLFGNASNNRWQYNAVYFNLLEKDTNSELNTFDKRDEKVFIANVFRQDFLTPGYTLSLSFHRSEDDATTHYDSNGFLVRPSEIGSVRPHSVKANYIGVTGDGHIGRLNVSDAFYWVFGTDSLHPVANRSQNISAQMAAAELSFDKDWLRIKATAFWASGDDDARDGTAKGFDSIFDATNFAGGPFSFWDRSGIALTQTGVLLKTPESLLPDLRSSKFEGQANFVNPGVQLLGLSLDAELTPRLKGVLNANYLRFDKTGALEFLLFQPNIRKNIGLDLGGGIIYRPFLNENMVIEAGLTGLLPGGGFEDLFSSTCSVPLCGAKSQKLFNGFVQIKLTY